MTLISFVVESFHFGCVSLSVEKSQLCTAISLYEEVNPFSLVCNFGDPSKFIPLDLIIISTKE